MKTSASIVVIGGGSIGCSTAYNLASRGFKDIILLEKRYLSSGSTGRCAASMRQQWGTEMNCLLSKYSIQHFETLNEELEYDRDIEFLQNGYLMVTYSHSEAQMLKKNLNLHQQLDIPVKMLSIEEVQELIPALNTENIKATSLCMKDGQANPFKVTDAYAKAAKRLGVTIYTQVEVIGFKRKKNGGIATVVTDKGEIRTDRVVNATGPYAASISRMLDHDLPVEPERHQIMVTEPLEPLLGPMVMNFHHKSYCQQVPHGSILIGYGDPKEPKGVNYQHSWQFLQKNCEQVLEQLPILKDVRMVRQWAGHYGISPDGQPILGEVPGLKGYYLALGCGKGFMLSPMIGELISQLIAEEETTLPIERLHIHRFQEGNLIVEPAVV